MHVWIPPIHVLVARSGGGRSVQPTSWPIWPPTSRPVRPMTVVLIYAVKVLYSSLISEWHKQRDAGVLEGKPAGAKVGRLTAGAGRDRPPSKGTRTRPPNGWPPPRPVPQIMEKHKRALGESLRERGATGQADQALMDAWNELRANNITTRAAADSTGMHRSTATRRAAPKPALRDPVPIVPVNKLTAAECARPSASSTAPVSSMPPRCRWATPPRRGQFLPVFDLHDVPHPGREQPGQRTPLPGPAPKRSARSW